MGTKVEVKQGGGFYIFLLVIAFAFSLVWNYLQGEKIIEKERSIYELKQNINVITEESDSKIVKLNDSINVMVAKAGVLTLTLNQYKDLYRSKYDDAKKINARNEELQGVLSAYSIAKDTIYLEKIITAAGVDSFAPYRSKWIDIDVILQPPSVAYEKRDSFDIYHNVVQKSLFWGLIKFGQKTESYNIVSYDDKSKILGFRVIKLIR